MSIKDISDAGISDHMPVLFTVSLPGSQSKSCFPMSQRRIINSSTASLFAAAFDTSPVVSRDISSFKDIEELVALFDSTCTEILDSVAPLKSKKSNLNGEPWQNDITRALRRECRCAERKWRKDRLHISLEILRNCLSKYQSAAKAAKTQYMSNLVQNNCHKPQVLFNVLNRIINPPEHIGIIPSTILCDRFCEFFTDKVSSIRALTCLLCNMLRHI